MSEENAAPETVAEAPAVVQPAEQAPVAETQTAPEAPAAEAPPPQENKAKERLSLRFSELTSQREAARQEAEFWRQQALSRQQEPEPSQYYDDGGDPDIDARIERAVEARLQREAEARAQKAQHETVQTLRTTLLESGLDGAALIASGGDVPFTQAMFDALTVSERPAVIADHLGRNPQEAARIAALSAAQQGVELARLEARLASQPRTTNAPPPPSTVGGRALASADPSSMSFEQYKAARESGQI
jgi:hypothetical protein